MAVTRHGSGRNTPSVRRKIEFAACGAEQITSPQRARAMLAPFHLCCDYRYLSGGI
jgi:hypothetical protein